MGTTNFGERREQLIVKIVQSIVNMRNSEEKSTSDTLETNEERKTIPNLTDGPNCVTVSTIKS